MAIYEAHTPRSCASLNQIGDQRNAVGYLKNGVLSSHVCFHPTRRDQQQRVGVIRTMAAKDFISMFSAALLEL